MSIRTHTKNSDGPQNELFHEDIYAALRGAVSALKGAKEVAKRLYPDLTPDAGARKLLDALNADRVQQLSPTQMILLLRWAKDVGYHLAMDYIADEAGYSRPLPISPDDEKAELQRAFVDAVNEAKRIGSRLERLGVR